MVQTLESGSSVFVSTRVVLNGKLGPGTVVFSSKTGKILQVLDRIVPQNYFSPDTTYVDYSPKVIMPGLVDAHVHLNEPGRTEWEGFESGTRAAAFGGVTTIIDMPLNAIPPTTTVENLKLKVNAAKGQCWVDVGFYGGVIPGNSQDLVPLVKAGVRGFKCFLIESGVDEFPAVSASDVEKAMAALKNEPTLLMFHAEMIPPISMSVSDTVQTSEPPLAPSGPLNAYKTFLDSRPPALETYAIEEIISLAPTAPELPLHIVHLSAVEGLPLVRSAKEKGIKLTAETCFHYLALDAESVQDGDTRHKCCPPIRPKNNQDQLWEALKNGEIETVVSDHSPCTAGLKKLGQGDFFEAWGGISTVGLGLSVLWTEGKDRGISVPDMVNWCAVKTAKQVGLETIKGQLAEGFDADICIFDPEASFTVTSAEMHFKNKITPYEHKTLNGIVCETWLRGERIFSRTEGFAEKAGPRGELLLEPRRHPN